MLATALRKNTQSTVMNALKDQLLKAGFSLPKKPEPVERKPVQPAAAPAPVARSTKPPTARPAAKQPPRRSPEQVAADAEQFSLRQAFAERERLEQSERDRQRHAAEAESKRKKQQREQLKQLLASQPALNDAAADIARNFMWARKIRRVYVTAEQLKAVNRGELGIVALDGRFLVHPADLVKAAAAIDQHALGLLVDPNVPSTEPDYDDPRYQVPDDLVW